MKLPTTTAGLIYLMVTSAWIGFCIGALIYR
jgi:hypothetical protein